MISTECQPSFSKRSARFLVLASLACALSSTTSLPSACLAESAVLSARRRTFFWTEYSWLLTTGPKITAPPRNCGERKRALTRAAGALLLPRLLGRALDVADALGLVRAGAALGELPLHHARQDVLAHGQAEDGVGELDIADFLVVEAFDRELHFLSPPAAGLAGALPLSAARSGALAWGLAAFSGIFGLKRGTSCAGSRPGPAHSRRGSRAPRPRP